MPVNRNLMSRFSKHKKAPALIGTGRKVARGTTLIAPANRDLLFKTLTCPTASNGRRFRPGLRSLIRKWGGQLAAPEGYSVKIDAPASTVPGSLSTYPYLLVSITAISEDFTI
jgi:hypothetical protein